MGKNNVVLFLVEGESEEKALKCPIEFFLEDLFEDIAVFFLRSTDPLKKNEKFKGGDITSDLDVRPQTIEKDIYDHFLENFFNQSHLYPEDISAIIQIVDMDGAYIPDDMVIEDHSCAKDHPIYYDDCIRTRNAYNIRRRNKLKRGNLDYLVKQANKPSTIEINVDGETIDIPYGIYYFSCNLDHVIHGEANLKENKVSMAKEWGERHTGNVFDFFSEFDGAVHNMTFNKSWGYIQKENHSLQQHTNINLLLEKCKKYGENE